MADLNAWVQAQLKRGYTKEQINAYLARKGYARGYAAPSPPSAMKQPSKVSLKASKPNYTLIILAAVAIAGVASLFLADKLQGTVQSEKQLLPSPKAEKSFCSEFQTVSYNVPCEQAVATALADTPGTVQKVAVGKIRIPEFSENKLNHLEKDGWMIDIALAQPYTDAKTQKQVATVQVGIGLNEDVGIHRRPLP